MRSTLRTASQQLSKPTWQERCLGLRKGSGWSSITLIDHRPQSYPLYIFSLLPIVCTSVCSLQGAHHFRAATLDGVGSSDAKLGRGRASDRRPLEQGGVMHEQLTSNEFAVIPCSQIRLSNRLESLSTRGIYCIPRIQLVAVAKPELLTCLFYASLAAVLCI